MIDLHRMVHDPSWTRVHLSEALAVCGLASLVLVAIKASKLRKRDIYREDILAAEAFDFHPISEEESSVDSGHIGSISIRRKSLFRLVSAAVFCLLLAFSATWFGAWNFIIVSNWADGDQREFIGDHVGAVVCYKKALRADPYLPHTHLLIAESLLTSGKISAAIPELKIAVAGDANDADAEAILGDALGTQGKFSDALTAYQKASKLDPGNANYHIASASCLEKLKMPRRAYDEYEAAVSLDDKSVRAHTNIGILLVDTNNLDEGFAHLKRAISLSPQDPVAHYNLATAYGRLGFYQGAVQEYRVAIDLNPSYLVAYFNLGMTRERMDEQVLAIDQFKLCLKQTPHSAEDKQAMQQARGEMARLQRGA